MTGTDLYRRILAYDYGDRERSDLMAQVWNVTPWVANVRTGNIESDTYREIVEWCRDNFGAEAWPIHGRDGVWQTGSATVYGETFIGFANWSDLETFTTRFGDRIIDSGAQE